MKKPLMSDDLLLRYSRQIMLPDVDIAGQETLRNSKVLVIGLGGLGCPVALYLAAAGVGELILADFDDVDVSNLQRQIAHSGSATGVNKAVSVAHTVNSLNPDVKVSPFPHKAKGRALEALVSQAEVVADCTDSFESRSAINAVCVSARVPLVSGAAIRWEGQLAVFDYRHAESPCYHCLYGQLGGEQLSCSQAGIMAPVVGVIGSMQALEAIKILLNTGVPLTGKLSVFDGKSASWREYKLKRDPDCPICGKADCGKTNVCD